MRLKGASASTTEASPGEAAASAKSRAGGTGTRGRDKGVIGLSGKRLHGVAEVHRIPYSTGIRSAVPRGGSLQESLELLGPAFLDPERHRERKELLERVWRHPAEPVLFNARHEFLKAQNCDPRAHTFERLRRHEVSEQQDNDDRECDRGNRNGWGQEELCFPGDLQ